MVSTNYSFIYFVYRTLFAQNCLSHHFHDILFYTRPTKKSRQFLQLCI
uniref:Uncharacterized protein n=1 Tax=virus sp. ct1Hk25 TaxID=2825803 RepID=A0A8S5RNX5_9VIRU|nr:MAG TPA: hypothetical protein [virus sp. ct1Hk25]